jgi:hypothetical protein
VETDELRNGSLGDLATMAEAESLAVVSSVGAPNRTRWARAHGDAPSRIITISAKGQRRNEFTEIPVINSFRRGKMKTSDPPTQTKNQLHSREPGAAAGLVPDEEGLVKSRKSF